MFSICSSPRLLIPQWRRRKANLWIFLHSNRIISSISCTNSSSMDDDLLSDPKQNRMDYDPSEDFFGLEVDLKPSVQRSIDFFLEIQDKKSMISAHCHVSTVLKCSVEGSQFSIFWNAVSKAPKQRSWFGPNGQYIRELPCPCCRGRGYMQCTECGGIERSRLDCSQCNGKGIRTCRQCFGDCVIWEESIDERPWERARSISPLKVKEDDEVDNLDIKLDVRRKSKRVYQSPPPEVGLKISRALRSLNAKTGLFSKHMKILHRDPKLHAQRVAAIKKTKGTAAARKQASETLKAFFRDPENRRKRSISMKGVKFFCSNCGREGHRRHYCPELIKDSSIERRFRCGLCGQRGHNRRTCQKSRSSEPTKRRDRRHHQCRVCGKSAHNRRTCPRGVRVIPSDDLKKGFMPPRGRSYSCHLCKGKGHNIRTCPSRKKDQVGN